MSVSRFTIDTNILIYAVDREDRNKHKRAIEIIDQAIFLDCVLTLQSICEFYAAATRKKHHQHDEACAIIKEWTTLFPLVASSASTLPIALRAVNQHKLSFWDAMLWATAKEANCSIILSEDFQDGFILSGIQIINPLRSDDSLKQITKLTDSFDMTSPIPITN